MRLLVSAGPTREYLDTVRFLSNASSGRMGYAIAEEAHRRGHDVVLVAGPVALAAPCGVAVVAVVSADEMLAACQKAFEHCDAAVMTAAVSDWRPVDREQTKPAKPDGGLQLALEPTPDICAALGSTKSGRIVVGFAVQDVDPYRRAEEKMWLKGCDAIVLNGPGNLGSLNGSIEIKTAAGPWRPAVSGAKSKLGRAVVDLVEELMTARTGA